MESPDSPLATPPLPSTRGRGREGGLHHYGNSMDDVGGAYNHPPLRRHPPPPPPPGMGPPQKLTFHNTRVQEMAMAHSSQKERSLSSLARRRGGFGGPERQGFDDFEGGAVEPPSSRDPRLNRKPTLQPPAPVAASVPKKPDIHSLLHQILSEHSYAKGKREEEEEELEKEGEGEGGGKEKMNNGLMSRRTTRNQTSCYLSVIDRTCRGVRTQLLKRQRSANDSRRSSRAKVAKNERKADTQAVVSKDKAILCSKHSDTVNLFCTTCRELVCQKCVTEGASHYNHVHYVLTAPGVGEEEKPKSEAVEDVARIASEPEPKGKAGTEDSAKAVLSESEGKVESKDEPIEEPKAEEMKGRMDGIDDEEADDEATDDATEGATDGTSKDEVEDASSAEAFPVVSLAGFELDLDTEPSSSEDEAMTDDEEESYIISLPSNLRHSESKISLPPVNFEPPPLAEDPLGCYKRILESKLSVESDEEEWAITNLGSRKIRLSKIEMARNGGGIGSYANQVLSKRLALYASNSSPSSRADSTESSPRRTRSSTTPVSEGEGDMETRFYSSLESSLEGGFPPSFSPSSQEPRPSQGAGRRDCPLRKRRRGRTGLPSPSSQRTIRKAKKLEEMMKVSKNCRQ